MRRPCALGGSVHASNGSAPRARRILFFVWAGLALGTAPLPTAAHAACVPPPSGLVSWYRAENDTIDAVSANNGTFQGTASYAAGEVDQAFNFDGTNDVLVGTLSLGSSFTVDLWLYPTAAGLYRHVVGNDSVNSPNYGSLYFNLDHMEYWQGNTLRVGASGGTTPLNTWTHVALTYDGSIARLYANGALVGTGSAHVESFNNGFAIGSALATGPWGLTVGKIDEVELFDRALSQLEVQSIYAAGADGKCPPATFTSTASATETATATATETATHTHTPTPTATPTDTPTAAPTATPTDTGTPMSTPTAAVAACEPSPRGDCGAAGLAFLKLSDNSDPSKRKLLWKWALGTATLADLGDPVNGGTNYALCVYDDGVLKLNPAIAAAGACDARPCWKATTTSRQYKSKSGNLDGITKIKMKAGTGTASIKMKGKGASLAMPFPLTDASAVTVQFVRNPGAAVECWEAVLPAPATVNDGGRFKDKSP